MAERLKIFIDGQEAKLFPITQNEDGVYYWNGKTYFRPYLRDFNNATLPAGFKKYSNGSHSYTNYNGVNIAVQKAIDISVVGGKKITSNYPCEIRISTTNAGSYCLARFTGTPEGTVDVWLAHTMNWPKTGTKLKAGDQIALVATKKHMEALGYANWGEHVHTYGKVNGNQYLLRKILLQSDVAKNKNAVLLKDINLRKDKTTKAELILTVKKGAVVRVTSEDYYNEGYEWRYVEFWKDYGLLWKGWMAVIRDGMKITDKPITNANGVIPQPPVVPAPVDPCDEKMKSLQVELANAKGKIVEQGTMLTTQIQQLKEKDDALRISESLVKRNEDIISSLNVKIDQINEEHSMEVSRLEGIIKDLQLGVDIPPVSTIPYEKMREEVFRVEGQRLHKTVVLLLERFRKFLQGLYR